VNSKRKLCKKESREEKKERKVDGMERQREKQVHRGKRYTNTCPNKENRRRKIKIDLFIRLSFLIVGGINQPWLGISI